MLECAIEEHYVGLSGIKEGHRIPPEGLRPTSDSGHCLSVICSLTPARDEDTHMYEGGEMHVR